MSFSFTCLGGSPIRSLPQKQSASNGPRTRPLNSRKRSARGRGPHCRFFFHSSCRPCRTATRYYQREECEAFDERGQMIAAVLILAGRFRLAKPLISTADAASLPMRQPRRTPECPKCQYPKLPNHGSHTPCLQPASRQADRFFLPRGETASN